MIKIIEINNKKIGELDETFKTFTKKVKRSKHLYGTKSKDPESWGIDGEFFEKRLLSENYTIIINESEEKKTYTSTAENMKNNGFWRTFGGHRPQIFLPVEFWGG